VGAALVLGSSADEPTELTARIGVHNKLDPTSTANKGGEKTDNVIATDYVLTVRPGADARHLQVTRWVSATHAPWDSGKPLYVVHTAHTVVAVLKSKKGGTYVFWSSSELRPSWSRVVRSTYGP
jgi:hypothetical protein